MSSYSEKTRWDTFTGRIAYVVDHNFKLGCKVIYGLQWGDFFYVLLMPFFANQGNNTLYTPGEQEYNGLWATAVITLSVLFVYVSLGILPFKRLQTSDLLDFLGPAMIVSLPYLLGLYLGVVWNDWLADAMFHRGSGLYDSTTANFAFDFMGVVFIFAICFLVSVAYFMMRAVSDAEKDWEDRKYGKPTYENLFGCACFSRCRRTSSNYDRINDNEFQYPEQFEKGNVFPSSSKPTNALMAMEARFDTVMYMITGFILGHFLGWIFVPFLANEMFPEVAPWTPFVWERLSATIVTLGTFSLLWLVVDMYGNETFVASVDRKTWWQNVALHASLTVNAGCAYAGALWLFNGAVVPLAKIIYQSLYPNYAVMPFLNTPVGYPVVFAGQTLMALLLTIAMAQIGTRVLIAAMYAIALQDVGGYKYALQLETSNIGSLVYNGLQFMDWFMLSFTLNSVRYALGNAFLVYGSGETMGATILSAMSIRALWFLVYVFWIALDSYRWFNGSGVFSVFSDVVEGSKNLMTGTYSGNAPNPFRGIGSRLRRRFGGGNRFGRKTPVDAFGDDESVQVEPTVPVG